MSEKGAKDNKKSLHPFLSRKRGVGARFFCPCIMEN